MVTTTSIVPGKVQINGIRPVDIPDYVPFVPPAAVHLPVIHQVTPKGEFGTKFIDTGRYTSRYGDIFDTNTNYFNPNSVLIKNMATAGQGRLGVRRLSANKKLSRIPLSLYVRKQPVKTYERDGAGQYKLDETGNRIEKGEIENGLYIGVKFDDSAKNKLIGELTTRQIVGTGGAPDTYVYPMVEFPAGVGDAYNEMGIQAGVRANVLQQSQIANFVQTSGVYPFNFRMFERLSTGGRSYANMLTGGDTGTFTLFDTQYNNTKYSIRRMIQSFTGRISATQTELIPCPFSTPFVYDENIDYICQLMYSIEKAHNTNLVDKGIYSYRQMNPFTARDHLGVPYEAIEIDDLVTWDMTYAVMSQFGISPFLDDEGKKPDYVTIPAVNDPFGLLTGLEMPLTPAQAWEINDRLVLEDMTSYVDDPEHQNVIINRQSDWWDVGYSMDVKLKAAELLNARKDIYVNFCATVFKPGSWNNKDDIYSRLSIINGQALLFPESEKWGVGSMRFSVNKIEALPNSEDMEWPMSGNLDLAAKWAAAGGNTEGIFKVSMSPDHGDYRILSTMSSPSIPFEADLISASGFALGGITVRPYDESRFFRPALPTGWAGSVDSVVKDQVPVKIFINVEKIAQTKFQLVVGDSTIDESSYAALTRDALEREIRSNLGGYVSADVTAEYTEASQGSLAVLHVLAHCYVNKAKYMMEFDLFADNIANYTEPNA